MTRRYTLRWLPYHSDLLRALVAQKPVPIDFPAESTIGLRPLSRAFLSNAKKSMVANC